MARIIERFRGLLINCPEYFKRADFRNFVLDEPSNVFVRVDGEDHDQAVGTISDVFLDYHGRREEYLSCPKDIWYELVAFCKSERLKSGVLWLTNVIEPEDDEATTDTTPMKGA